MSKKLGYVIGGVLMAVAIFTLIFLDPEPDVPVKVEVVRPARVYTVPDAGALETRTFPGVVQGAERVPLSFRVSGTIQELPAREAMAVQTNDVVAKLDARDFDSQVAATEGQLSEAKAQLVAMESGERDEVIKMLEATVRAAKAAHDESITEFGRQKQLFAKNIISKSELDKHELRMMTRKEELEAAEQDLARGRTGARPEDIDAQKARIRSLEAQAKAARDALADTVLRAPFDGRVTKRYFENFQEVRAGQTVIELAAIDTIEVVADIPESIVAIVKREWIQKFTVSFDFAPDQSFDAEFVEMSAQADRRTSTYRITVSMVQPDTVNVLPGMTGALGIHLNQSFEEGLQGYLVPANAVFANAAGEPQVWKVDPATMRVKRQAVTIGEVVGGHVTVKTGVAKGDVVVTAGVHLLEPDQQVRLLEQASN